MLQSLLCYQQILLRSLSNEQLLSLKNEDKREKVTVQSKNFLEPKRKNGQTKILHKEETHVLIIVLNFAREQLIRGPNNGNKCSQLNDSEFNAEDMTC